MLNKIIIETDPMGKPRMTQRDKWAKRPAVQKYWNYKDELKVACKDMPEDTNLITWDVFFAMPKSWSEKKKREKGGTSHDQKPDRDNIDKGILDAILGEDKLISHGTLNKWWDDGNGPRIILQWGNEVKRYGHQ